MNNTILSAKNSFQEGLIMDFSPEQTQAGCLTNALNATLLTFNGNEMALQNDMGNARVETARLPDGYIPVGTCEFGDIIYIVSYNPLTNKSQIGCFPSPERNISSEEIGGLDQTLSASDFQELDTDGNPTGVLKATSVKKILMEKSLNPGDKFIIYDKSKNIQKEQFITDIGNTDHEYGKFPKLLKIHVVAIEDSGKINYLDSSLKWYEIKSGDTMEYHDYFMLDCKYDDDTGGLVPDIESYRNLLSSGYSVFQSKVSGKLALLIELEKISGFSCTHSIQISDERYDEVTETYYKDYTIFLNSSWTTDNLDINPSGLYIKNNNWSIEDDAIQPEYEQIQFSRHYEPEKNISFQEYKSQYSYEQVKNNFLRLFDNQDVNYLPSKVTIVNKSGNKELLFNAYKKFNDSTKYYFIDSSGKPVSVNKYPYKITDFSKNYYTDTFLHNYFHIDIPKQFYKISLPSKSKDGIQYIYSNLLHTYEVCPKMPYGNLEEYSILNTIDFSKIGTGLPKDLREWRYYNTGQVSTLTFGLDVYPENGKGVSLIELEFYDNKGKTGTLEIKGRNSYSGTFTEIIPLNIASQVIPAEQGHIYQELQLTQDLTKPSNVSEISINTIKNYKKEIDAVDGSEFETLVWAYRNNLIIENDGKLYRSNAGIIQSNWLYFVKIKVHYQDYNTLGEFDNIRVENPKEYERWFWTNDMWNAQYYNVRDFANESPYLAIDVLGEFLSNDNITVTNSDNIKNDSNPDNSPIYNTLSYSKYSINGTDNVELYLTPKLNNSYDTFKLDIKPNQLFYDAYLDEISNIEVQIPEKVYPDQQSYYQDEKLIEPTNTGFLSDNFSLDSHLISSASISEKVNYIDHTGQLKNTENVGYRLDAYDYCSVNEITGNIELTPIVLSMNGAFYSKMAAVSTKEKLITAPKYKPLLESFEEEDLKNYNIGITAFKPNFTESSFNYMHFIKGLNFGSGQWANGDIYLLTQDENGLKYEKELINSYLKEGTVISASDAVNLSVVTSELSDIQFFPIFNITSHDNDSRVRMQMHDSNNKRCKYSLLNYQAKDWVICKHTSDFVEDYAVQGYSVWENITNIPNYTTTLMSLVIKDEVGSYIPLNIFCHTALQKYKGKTFRQITQSFTDVAKHDRNPCKYFGFRSLAEIIASYLSRIYIKSEEPVDVKIQIGNQYIYNKPYQEKWIKDFVIRPRVENINDIITIGNISFKKYIEDVQSYIPIKNLNNVTFQYNDSSSSLIRFEHICNYNIGTLQTKLSRRDTQNSTNEAFFQDSAYGDKVTTVEDSITDRTVYYLNNDGGVSTQTRGIKLQNMEGDLTDIELSAFDNILKIKDGKVVSNAIRGNETFRIRRESTDDDNEVHRIEYATYPTLQVGNQSFGFTNIKSY